MKTIRRAICTAHCVCVLCISMPVVANAEGTPTPPPPPQEEKQTPAPVQAPDPPPPPQQTMTPTATSTPTPTQEPTSNHQATNEAIIMDEVIKEAVQKSTNLGRMGRGSVSGGGGVGGTHLDHE